MTSAEITPSRTKKECHNICVCLTFDGADPQSQVLWFIFKVLCIALIILCISSHIRRRWPSKSGFVIYFQSALHCTDHLIIYAYRLTFDGADPQSQVLCFVFKVLCIALISFKASQDFTLNVLNILNGLGVLLCFDTFSLELRCVFYFYFRHELRSTFVLTTLVFELRSTVSFYFSARTAFGLWGCGANCPCRRRCVRHF